jgi:hypothetical protein
MQDVVFTWMFEGWERVRERGHVDVAASIRQITNVVWAENDPFAAYFDDKERWQKGGQTLVPTESLWNNMRDWATRNGDTVLFEAIGDKPMALSGQFRMRASRGFQSMGRINKSQGAKIALWWGEKSQYQCWIIPYTYIGNSG